jgi:hypothetical protein
MRILTLTGLAVGTLLMATAGTMPAKAMPVEPSVINKAIPADTNITDVRWRRHHWRGRHWGWYGPRYYPYSSYGYYRPYYRPGPYFSVGPRGFRFGIW